MYSSPSPQPSPPRGRGRTSLLFFPEWEVFPHEGKLPHADVISDRLQTLVALAEKPFIPTRESATSQEPAALPQGFGVRQSSGALGSRGAVESGRRLPQSKTQARDEGEQPADANRGLGNSRPDSDDGRRSTPSLPIVVTSVTALLQKTFAPGDLKNRTRRLQRGDKIAPLDLIEWLEDQGYEPEAQVSQKGEIALRGGIVDIFPPVAPWPVRLEFFGDELESLREFDPLTQISRQEIAAVTIPPAGELGILKRDTNKQPLVSLLRLSSARNHFPFLRAGAAFHPRR